MLSVSEKPIIKTLVSNMRRWQIKSIAMEDYFQMLSNKGTILDFKEKRLLSEQVRRSKIIKISYRRSATGLITVFNLVEN